MRGFCLKTKNAGHNQCGFTCVLFLKLVYLKL